MAASSRTSSAELPAAESEELTPGLVIEDRFRVDHAIGRGGMGYVYVGEHLTVGRKIAIKVLTRQWSGNATIAQRFRAEARAASAAGHPNIIQVFDAGELPDGRLYLVMEHLAGCNVLEEIEQSGPFEPDRACRIMRDVGRAIRAAHTHGIIHRDLKPENIMLVPTREGELVKVLDFGIAAEPDQGERLTTPGLTVGTPETMAPEQARGHDPTRLFDIYALGSIFFEMLVGEPPFTGPTPLAIITEKMTRAAPPVASRREGLDPALADLVDRCLALEPADWPPSVDAVLEQLQAVMDGTARSTAFAPTTPRVAPTRELGHPPAQATSSGSSRGRVFLAAGAAALVALVGGYFAYAAGTNQTTPDPVPEAALARADGPAPPPTPSPAAIEEEDSTREPASAGAGTTASKTEVGAGDGDEDNPPPEQADAETKPVTTKKRRRGKRSRGKRPTPAADAADSPTCLRAQVGARDARRAYDWRGVLRYTRDRQCWPSAEERRKLRTLALKEQGRWDRCASAGAGSSDPEVQRWVALCKKRASL